MKTKKLKIPSEVGRLASSIDYPKNKTKKLAILCPGFLDSKDYKGLVNLSKELCKRDYTVIRFNPIGVWDSDGNISQYNITQYLKDIKNILNFMLNQKKYENILIGGHSRGGQMAILYAATDSRISSVLAIMPSVGSIDGPRRIQWKKEGFCHSERDLPDNPNKKISYQVPFTHVLDRDQYNAYEEVEKIKVPIVLLTGELDKIVSSSSVKKIYNNANEPKSFFCIPEIGHDYRFSNKEVETVNKILLKQMDSLNI